MDPIEEAIENDANITVNYISPKYTPQESLINTAIGAGVGLACVGIILGTGKLINAVGTALYERRVRKLEKKAAEEAPKEAPEEV
jgi:uncharacterized membrane protein YciS (DUF1049 family)